MSACAVVGLADDQAAGQLGLLAMAEPATDSTVPVVDGQPQWQRISEDEARAAAGDKAVDEVLAEVGRKGRASAERYRVAGHPIVDQD